MFLVDTSAWIHSLRPDGARDVVTKVTAVMMQGEACWCPPVRLELWNGASGTHEKRVLTEMGKELPDLEISTQVWTIAYSLAEESRTRGLTIPPIDILIAACARHHGVQLLHADRHFDQLDLV